MNAPDPRFLPDQELKRLSSLLQEASFAVAVYEGPSHLTSFSNAAHDQMVGGRVLQGRPLLECIPELRGQALMAMLDQVFETGEKQRILECPLELGRSDERRQFWLEVTCQPLRDATGTPSGVFVSAVDVSAHVRSRQRMVASEELLRRSEDRFSAIFEHASFAIYLLKVPNTEIVDVNPAWVDLFGYSKAEVIGKTSVQLGMHQEFEGRSRVVEEFERHGVVRNLETTVTNKFGEVKVTSNSLKRLTLGGEAHVLGTFIDITHQRRAEAALREQERQFRELIDNLPALAWSTGPDGRGTFYNRRLYEYTGTTFAQMDGLGWRSVLDPDGVEDIVQFWSQSIARGKPFEMEFKMRRADGVFQWFLTRVQPLTDSTGRLVSWIGTGINVDERRKARVSRETLVSELRDALEVRDEFLSGAAHELRTPLTSLQLQLDLIDRILQTADDDRIARSLQKLQGAVRQSGRLAQLVDRLLDISRIATGTLSLSIQEVDLVAVVREVVQRYSGDATSVGSAVALDDDGPLLGRWDQLRLEQVVTNLLSNALKYGEGRPIELVTRAGPDVAILSVQDHGIGIDAEDLVRIFGRFERAVPAKHFGGLGLGLYITKEIVDAHGGRIEVSSKLGIGSKFTVTLPRSAG